MTDKYLSNKPRALSNDTDCSPSWCYEEPEGITVVHEMRRGNGTILMRTDQIVIPWRYLRAALKRKDKTKPPTEQSP